MPLWVLETELWMSDGYRNNLMDVRKTLKQHVLWTYHLVIPTIIFIRQFDFRKHYRVFHPVSSEVRRVRVNIHPTTLSGFRFSTSWPFTVDKFPAVFVDGYKVQHYGIHGRRFQTLHGRLQYREHTSEIESYSCLHTIHYQWILINETAFSVTFWEFRSVMLLIVVNFPGIENILYVLSSSY